MGHSAGVDGVALFFAHCAFFKKKMETDLKIFLQIHIFAKHIFILALRMIEVFNVQKLVGLVES